MKIAHIFFDVDLRCAHDGLRHIVLKKKITVKERDFVVFINRSQDRIKLMSGDMRIVTYLNDGKKVNIETLTHLPSYFDGKDFDYSSALRKLILQKLARRNIKT